MFVYSTSALVQSRQQAHTVHWRGCVMVSVRGTFNSAAQLIAATFHYDAACVHVYVCTVLYGTVDIHK